MSSVEIYCPANIRAYARTDTPASHIFREILRRIVDGTCQNPKEWAVVALEEYPGPEGKHSKHELCVSCRMESPKFCHGCSSSP